MYHVQCTLQKKSENNSITSQVSWLPEKYAVVGKFLKLKTNEEWVDNWEVIGKGAKKLTKDVIKEEQNYKKMRNVTDI